LDNALASLITAGAGTGVPTNPSSRYCNVEIKSYTLLDGTPVKYLVRRVLPQPAIYRSLQTYVVVDGDRIDNLAARFLGDPLLYWMICDANGVVDPDSLTSASQVGRTILIPVAASIPTGARSG
jgi:hypothetical protein